MRRACLLFRSSSSSPSLLHLSAQAHNCLISPFFFSSAAPLMVFAGCGPVPHETRPQKAAESLIAGAAHPALPITSAKGARWHLTHCRSRNSHPKQPNESSGLPRARPSARCATRRRNVLSSTRPSFRQLISHTVTPITVSILPQQASSLTRRLSKIGTTYSP